MTSDSASENDSGPAPVPGDAPGSQAELDAETRRAVIAAGALARQGSEEPVALVSLTDEQLVLLTGEGATGQIVAPWLSAPEASGHAPLLLAAALRTLVAQGSMAPEGAVAALEGREPEGDEMRYVPSMLVLGVVARRLLSTRTVTVTVLRGDGASGGALQIHLDLDGAILIEQISEAGIHHFSMSPLADAERALAVELCAPSTLEAMTGLDEPLVIGRADPSAVRERQDVTDHVAPGSWERRVDVIDRRDGRREQVAVIPGGDAALVMWPLDGNEPTGEPERVEVEAALVPGTGLEDLVRELLSLE